MLMVVGVVAVMRLLCGHVETPIPRLGKGNEDTLLKQTMVQLLAVTEQFFDQ